MDTSSEPSFPRIPWRLAPPLTALYAGAIALLTWPWLATASSRVLRHWDPPFHAWKLMFAARTLLSGHILPPDGNTNLYYPHSGAFFYEALHWPQAVFAAPLLAAGANPTLTYHITLVFFWALSGALFWAWLRALGARPLGAALGGLFFTVLPYRMSYAVEFNMQLAFGLPLFLLAMTRFFQRPGYRYALLAAVAWWLQATSELYQAVFLLFALPFLALPLLARDPALLRSGRRFWGPVAAAAALSAALSLPFLLPYASTLGDGTLTRSLEEMQLHSLEPFSYLRRWGRLRLLPKPTAIDDEMSVYPTLALFAAAAWAFLAHRRPPSGAHQRAAAWLLGAACALFAALSALSHWLPGAGIVVSLSWTAFAAVLLTIPPLLRRGRSVRRAAVAGLGAAALFGVVMSFGPDIRILATEAKAPNVLFHVLHALVPGLAGFRVVSRFAVFPVMALCVAAAFGVDAAADALRARPRALRAFALLLFLALFLAECVHPKRLRTRPVRDTSRSAVLASLDARTEPYVLAVVPMGLRDLDSEHMLTIERDDRLGIWAWGGTFPIWTRKVQASLQNLSKVVPERAAQLLRQTWPETLVLEDRRRFPGILPEDYAAWFGPIAETIAEDRSFRLLRILPDTVERNEALKLVRRDFARTLPVARFTLSTRGAPARVWLDLNGEPMGVWNVASNPVECSVAIPPDILVPHLPERFRFHAEENRKFRLDDFRLDAGPAPENCAVVPDHIPELPWLFMFHNLPKEATPLDVRYPGGITLCGAMIRPGKTTPGIVPLRIFLRFAKTNHPMSDVVLAPGFAQNGSVVFRHPVRRHSQIDRNAFGGARGRIVSFDITLPVPSVVRPGETYDLTLDLMSPDNRRITGRDADGRKVRHAELGLLWHAESLAR